jgi:hypothetical protein
VLLCEEVLEVAPKGLGVGGGLISGGEGVATEVVASLEEALDGVSGGRHFYFLVLCQRKRGIYTLPGGVSFTGIK